MSTPNQVLVRNVLRNSAKIRILRQKVKDFTYKINRFKCPGRIRMVMFCILKANEEEMQQQRGISPQDVSESNGSLQQKTMKNRHFQSNFFVKCVCILFKSFVLVQTEQYIKIDDNAFLFD